MLTLTNNFFIIKSYKKSLYQLQSKKKISQHIYSNFKKFIFYVFYLIRYKFLTFFIISFIFISSFRFILPKSFIQFSTKDYHEKIKNVCSNASASALINNVKIIDDKNPDFILISGEATQYPNFYNYEFKNNNNIIIYLKDNSIIKGLVNTVTYKKPVIKLQEKYITFNIKIPNKNIKDIDVLKNAFMEVSMVTSGIQGYIISIVNFFRKLTDKKNLKVIRCFLFIYIFIILVTLTFSLIQNKKKILSDYNIELEYIGKAPYKNNQQYYKELNKLLNLKNQLKFLENKPTGVNWLFFYFIILFFLYFSKTDIIYFILKLLVVYYKNDDNFNRANIVEIILSPGLKNDYLRLSFIFLIFILVFFCIYLVKLIFIRSVNKLKKNFIVMLDILDELYYILFLELSNKDYNQFTYERIEKLKKKMSDEALFLMRLKYLPYVLFLFIFIIIFMIYMASNNNEMINFTCNTISLLHLLQQPALKKNAVMKEIKQVITEINNTVSILIIALTVLMIKTIIDIKQIVYNFTISIAYNQSIKERTFLINKLEEKYQQFKFLEQIYKQNDENITYEEIVIDENFKQQYGRTPLMTAFKEYTVSLNNNVVTEGPSGSGKSTIFSIIIGLLINKGIGIKVKGFTQQNFKDKMIENHIPRSNKLFPHYQLQQSIKNNQRMPIGLVSNLFHIKQFPKIDPSKNLLKIIENNIIDYVPLDKYEDAKKALTLIIHYFFKKNEIEILDNSFNNKIIPQSLLTRIEFAKIFFQYTVDIILNKPKNLTIILVDEPYARIKKEKSIEIFLLVSKMQNFFIDYFNVNIMLNTIDHTKINEKIPNNINIDQRSAHILRELKVLLKPYKMKNLKKRQDMEKNKIFLQIQNQLNLKGKTRFSQDRFLKLSDKYKGRIKIIMHFFLQNKIERARWLEFKNQKDQLYKQMKKKLENIYKIKKKIQRRNIKFKISNKKLIVQKV